MKRFIPYLLVAIFLLGFSSHLLAQAPVLFTIGDEKVSADEFITVYKKNNVGKEADFSESSLRDYLNLYINFRLKVKEAKDMKLDTAASVNTELGTYRSTLAKSYLVDKDLADALVKETYDRQQKDVHILHIFVRTGPNALPADTLKAWKKINAVYALIKKGKEFSTMARDSSEDPSAKENGGDLGYISALQVVYPIENAAYTTAVGQISKPFRIPGLGYDIVKVIDTRPSRGVIQVAHIFVKLTKTMSHNDSLQAKKKIDDIYDQLVKGGTFEDLAKGQSEDKTSAGDGGKLAPFGTGKMVAEFENAAFGLKNVGDYSKPVKTKYGWHIIKLLDKKQNPSFDEVKDALKKQVEKDSRADLARQSLISKVKADYTFTENAQAKKELLNKIDSSLLKGLWKASDVEGAKATLFSFTDKKYKPETKNYTQKEFADFIEKNQRRFQSSGSKEAIYDKLYQQFVDNSALSFEEMRLSYKYPAFADLMKEYMDGILLFELTDQKVWSKAVKDSVGLKAFYAANNTKYPDEEKIKITTYTAKSADALDQLKKLKGKGATDDAIKTKLNKKDADNITITTETLKRNQFDTDSKGLEWKAGSSTTVNGDNGAKKYMVVNETIPVGPKPLDEARGYVVADYQEKLEKDWIQTLREKYPVHINEDVLMSLVKK